MKKLVCALAMNLILSFPLFSDIKQEYSREIISLNITQIIVLDDNTCWILVGDHWILIRFYEHAEWCGCNIYD